MKKFSIFKFQFSINKGFTLIELLVVVAIIGILSSFLMANFVGIRQRARDGQRKSDLRQIQSALEMYRADQGNYPTSSLVNCPVSAPTYFGNEPTCNVTYMQKVPVDPLNTGKYIYTYSSGGTTYSLYSCLENTNDLQKDPSNNSTYCDGGTTNWSFTLQNP